ncbi:tyrosine-type recombinase/integrase [Loigolactobacillus bifermentans]|uniref:tyrosine-type recombinase/integrase n=1 Tax=Loigolactobacillus bifermentans TaxID=1607 RepID=UPI0012AA602C|nr:tyrosine-type recombinase/integrase [Loigolactobacillus bifermentans]QGG60126.1 tyrosine-type recombinase/integrase [Loigolactobacillus bifermentans]
MFLTEYHTKVWKTPGFALALKKNVSCPILKGGVAHFLLKNPSPVKRERIISKLKYINDTKLKSDSRIHSYETATKKRVYRVAFKRTIMGVVNRFERQGFETKEDAAIWADETLRQAILMNGKAKNVTVQEYYEAWSKKNISTGRWAKDSERTYGFIFRTYILPRYKNIRLIDINHQEFQNYLNWLATVERPNGLIGYSSSTLHTVHNMFSVLINDAVQNEIVAVNKIKRMQIPSGQHKRNIEISKGNYDKAIALARVMLSPLELGAFYLSLYGLRHSEILGMQFESVHQDHVFVKMTRTKAVSEGQEKTKTDLSRRVVPISLKTANILAAAMQYSKKVCESTQHECSPNSFIFVNDFGNPAGYGWINKCFQRISKKLGFYIYPHLMRHAFATFAMPGADDQKDVSNILGHKNLEMTMAYDTGTKEGQRKVINFLDL